MYTNLSCGVDECNSKVEIGISTSCVDPQIPLDRGQDRAHDEHTRYDEAVSHVCKENKQGQVKLAIINVFTVDET